MLTKVSLFVCLFFFTYAFTQTGRQADSVSAYKRTLAECKTYEDSLKWYQANINVGIGLLKLRNDSEPQRVRRDTVVVVKKWVKLKYPPVKKIKREN